MQHVRLEGIMAQASHFAAGAAQAACNCQSQMRIDTYAAPTRRGPAQIATCLDCGETLPAPSADLSALRQAIAAGLM